MKKKLINIFVLMLTSVVTFAQVAETTVPKEPSKLPGIVSDPMNYVILFTIAILLATVLVMARVIKLLTWQIAGKPAQATEASSAHVTAKRETFWSKLGRQMNDAVPIEKEADVLLDHNYDGIKELDNNLPPWWKYGFYLTIIFAFVYLINLHVIGSGNVQLDEYYAQLAEADLLKQERLKLVANNVDENSVTLLSAEADLLAGQKTFTEKCVVCHGKAGEGNVGPNLTDDYWIHGGDIKDVFKIVKYGFPSKGMISWESQLNPVQMQQVASYIKSLRGSNPANPKAPQGDLYSATGIAATDSVAAVVSDSATTGSSDSSIVVK
ncbi:MAG TPA: cbb3-type cytochrome c oxidase N-terminal domain-containing protein [Bacteroidia bacterium]|nr:cbb3-type cytochrome c oxidase N-terminal domain-containing protein [Bacteroidia bacterium]